MEQASKIFANELLTVLEFNQITDINHRKNIIVVLMTNTNRGIEFQNCQISATPIFLFSFTLKQSQQYLSNRNIYRNWFENKFFIQLLNGIGNIPALLSEIPKFSKFKYKPMKDLMYLLLKYPILSLMSLLNDIFQIIIFIQ